jgi:hypothetical protein
MTIVPIRKDSILPQNPDLECGPTNTPVVQLGENPPPDRFESGGPSLGEVVDGRKSRQS